MVQQTIDSKISEYGLANPDNNTPTRDKQLPAAVKKTALRELQNENRIIAPSSIGNSLFSKDRGPIVDTYKVEPGIKRPSPECSVSPSCNQSPISNTANAHLVYVRRKSEGDTGKSITPDGANVGTDCLYSGQVGRLEETVKQRPQIKEPKVSRFPALAPLPRALLSTSAKPSISFPFGNSGARLAPPGPNNQQASSDPNGMKNLHQEERYHRLQMLLKKLNESDQEDYTQSMFLHADEATENLLFFLAKTLSLVILVHVFGSMYFY